MSDSKDVGARDAAWERVSEHFAALGEDLRQRLEVPGPEGADQPERDSVRDALRTLGDAAERLAGTIGDVVRDPQIQSDAKQAAASLVDALGLTFSQVGDEFRRRAERVGSERDEPWEPPVPEIDRPGEAGPPPGPGEGTRDV